MKRRPSRLLIAIGLMAATVAGPAMDGAVLAQDLAASPSVPPSSFITDLSAFGLPDEARLAADAGLDVPDVLPPPADNGLDAIAARAAAMVDATDKAAWNLGPLAERLEYAPFGAFEFVRDSIGYDPYPGVLRGGLGTLLARAGNDVDRALLLKALLDRMAVPSRLVVGTLDEPATAALMARSFIAPSKPLSPTPVDGQELGDLAALAARARRDYAVLRRTLGDRDVRMDGSANADAAAEARRHVWVQMRFGTDWLDLDPSMPDSQPGQVLTETADILSAVPEEWRHTVAVRLIAERLSDGRLSERTVLEHELNAATAARQDIYLAMQPVSDKLGATIGEALGAGAGWRPALYVGNEPILGDPFPVVPETDIFDGTQSGEEFSALRLEVTVSVPGSEPATTSRTLIDRLSPTARAAESIAREALTPLTMRQGVPVELSTVMHVLVSTGGFDARAHHAWRQVAAQFAKMLGQDPELAGEYGFPTTMLPMTVADESLVLASERVIADGIDGAPGIRAYIARPRVFLTSVGPTAQDGRVTTSIDLLTDTVRIIVGDGQDGVGAARRQLWYGVLEGALESQFLLTRIAASGMSGGLLQGVSFGLTGSPTLLTQDGPVAAAAAALARDLEGGAIAVVPGDVATADAWWSVDPATGISRARLAPGTGGGNYVNGSFGGGRILVDPSQVPQTQQEVREVMRQAVAAVENASKPPVQPACTLFGHEYTATQCIAIIAAAGLFVLGVVVAIIIWVV